MNTPIKTVLFFTGLLTLLCACTSTSTGPNDSAVKYSEAKNKHDSGYRDYAISHDQWLINYSLRASDSSQAYLYALRRAAEITQQEGYDWFEVVSKQNDVQRAKVEPRSRVAVERNYTQQTQCGLLACRTSTTPSTSYTAHMGISNSVKSRRDLVQSQIEIRMGKGISPELANIYKPEDIFSRANETSSR